MNANSWTELKAPVGITDVVFVTDAQCRLSSEVKKHFLDWKRVVEARLITLVVGRSPGDLVHISDEIRTVQTLDADSDAVGRLFSI